MPTCNFFFLFHLTFNCKYWDKIDPEKSCQTNPQTQAIVNSICHFDWLGNQRLNVSGDFPLLLMNLPIKFKRQGREEIYFKRSSSSRRQAFPLLLLHSFFSYLSFSLPLSVPFLLLLPFCLFSVLQSTAKCLHTSLRCYKWLCRAVNLRALSDL